MQNELTSQITVHGDGTIANIYLDHQIYNINDQNSGTSSFQATYNDGGTYNRHCVITQPGTYTDINGVFTGLTLSGEPSSGGQCYLSDVNQNVLTSQITVLGDSTIANIYLDHQISNINDQNSGTSSFQAIY